MTYRVCPVTGFIYKVWTKDEKQNEIKICAPLKVVASTRDRDSNNWGRALKWWDADGHKHEWVMHEAQLAAGNRAVIAYLLAGGLGIEPDAGDDVIEYIQSVRPHQRTTIVSETGWQGDSFVLPDQIVGNGDQDHHQITYAPIAASKHLFAVQGTIDGWKQEVGSLCRLNSRLLFSTSVSLSAPTLKLLGEEGGGFHLFSPSSCGKTTSLVTAGSVWGGGGEIGFADTWRSTGNSLELLASAHNDCFLALDELGQLEAHEAIKVPYLLASGQPKNRMNADGSARRQASWRLQFLSTGELGIEQLARTVNARVRGGMEVRITHVPADSKKGFGVFECIHGCATAKEFADRLKSAASAQYGAVGPDWLRCLVSDRDACAQQLREYIREFEEAHMPLNPGREVGRVVHRFAVVSAAGELATELGLTGWQMGEAEWGAATCLAAWLAHRGGAQHAFDAEQMIAQVRHFIQAHGASRFERLDDPNRYAIRDRAGYYRGAQHGEPATYLFHTEVFRRDVCRGYDHHAVLAALKEAGYLLVTDAKRMDKLVRLRNRREWLYCVSESILSAGDKRGQRFRLDADAGDDTDDASSDVSD